MTQMQMAPDAPSPPHFDVCKSLPGKGVTVLEASAGTGKTFTIAALVARFVAERVPVSEILAVTFTRMATGELRDRVRARLVSAEEGLARFLDSGEPVHPDDSVLCLLASGARLQVEERRARLAAALTSFDEATITTTHGFCQLMLSGLGVSGDVAAGASLLEDPRDIVEEAVDDLYVRWAILHKEAPSFSRRDALEIGNAAVSSPGTELEPAPSSSPAGLRRRLADGVRREVERRLLDANLLTFDDLLVRLRESLRDPRRGPAACARLRSRYSVVLVDEFQDTDPIQWDVVNEAFGGGETRLVLIGDPKQAIYAFRGADVYAYLDAAERADQRYTLGVNWRSDADLLAGFDALLDPVQLGHPEIVFRPVRAAPQHQLPGLVEAPVPAPLRARVVYTKDHGLTLTRSGDVQKDAAVEFVARDAAADIVRLLESPAELIDYDDMGNERSRRTLVPGDIAILVGKNRQARTVQDALRAVAVPSVVAGAESVLSTTAAGDWLSLLGAMEQPANRARAVAVSLTPFIGLSAEAVATAGEAEWEDIHTRLHRWSETLRRRGVASLFRSVLAGEGVPARLLKDRDGERRLTDLGHIAQLLHKEASEGQHGPPALRAWLARRIEEATAGREGTDAEERSRWLDSDADAVKVLTVHRSKGLEFPIVYCPFLWEPQTTSKGRPVVYHDPEDRLRKLDVAGSQGGPEYDQHFDLYRQEERGEGLRQLYVALTRARHQAVVWWVPTYNGHQSSLGRLLTAREPDGAVQTSSRRMPKSDEVSALLEEIGARAPAGIVSVERATGGDSPMWSGRAGGAIGPLQVAAFDRSLDVRWRRTSYSGITALVHGGPEVASEPEEPGTSDEPQQVVPAEVPGTTSGLVTPGDLSQGSLPSPWADLPGGVEMGTFVHGILEECDFSSEDLEAELIRAIGTRRSRYATDPEVTAPLVAALREALTTPLGPAAYGVSLRELGRRDRLDEMGFELPLAGGDRPGNDDVVSTGDIARLFQLHAQPEGPLAGYGDRLRDPLLGTDLRGYLTGSLDLVFRLSPDGNGAQRFFVADYKTNWMGGEGEALSAWHYRPAALDAEMQRMHYPLQAVLYQVALHRYLRWRLPDYEPEVHLGGVLYLFLRGMCGPDTPTVGGERCGVFAWRPPVSLVTDLSELFEVGS